jgi:exodeoxyribonuclease VII small subunit
LGTTDKSELSGASLGFEEALGKLEAIVHDLEEGQIGLAESLGRYEEGIKLLKQCYGLLEHAERRIELLTGIDADGNPLTVPFDEAAAASLEEKAQSRARRRSQATAVNAPSARGSAGKPPRVSDLDVPRDLF